MNGRNTPIDNDGERLRELSYLTAAVSHHVINAFSAIVSNAELLRTRDGNATDSADVEHLGASVVDTAMNASHIARQLIDWARRASSLDGDPSGQKSPAVDLNDLIREMVEREKGLVSSPVDWVLNLGPIPLFSSGVGGLGTMLGFLLRNACEALPGGVGTVEVSTYTDPRNWLIVAIRDTGCGMTAEVLRRASEPFFSTKPEHSGVGLTIAQAIWRRNRGAVSIESRPGLGTTIRLSIGPIAPRPVVITVPLPDYQKPP